MKYTVSLAQSRDRAAIAAVETVEKYGERFPLRVVTAAYRLPPSATHEDMHAGVAALAGKIAADNGGEEPLVVVQYAGACSTVAAYLRDEWRRGLRQRPPMTVTTSPSATDGTTIYVPARKLADTLATEYRARRVEFASDAPGIRRLRDQMTHFAPRETRAGNLVLGDEEMPDYDDQVVALMLAVIRRGYGEPRFITGDDRVWPTRRTAVEHVGGRLY